MIAGAALHFKRRLVELEDTGSSETAKSAEEPVGQQLLFVRATSPPLRIQVRVIFLLKFVQVVQFGLV